MKGYKGDKVIINQASNLMEKNKDLEGKWLKRVICLRTICLRTVKRRCRQLMLSSLNEYKKKSKFRTQVKAAGNISIRKEVKRNNSKLLRETIEMDK